MDIKQLDAASAYGKALQNLDKPGIDATDGKGDIAGDFANMVDDVFGDMAQSTGRAEMTASQVLMGKADIVDVVTAATNAEMVVDTVVTVRDKVIAAYNDILKMPI